MNFCRGLKKWLIVASYLLCCGVLQAYSNKIDREALVMRHNVTLTEINEYAPLSVGNGRFCYTADITGMQTFPDFYRKGIPLTTMAEWGWHSFPNTENYRFSDVLRTVNAYGKQVPYPIGATAGYEYLRANPHQTSLALIGLQAAGGKNLSIEALSGVHQQLNLWQGVLESHFCLFGSPVSVVTFCHPIKDELVYCVQSPLFAEKKIGISITFPYPSAAFSGDPAIGGKQDRHSSIIILQEKNEWLIRHKVDNLVYYCRLRTLGNVVLKEISKHNYFLEILSGQEKLILMVDFFQKKEMDDSLADYESAFQTNKEAWKQFWMSGGAVDLSNSKDPRWMELERRIVLSQYQTAIQSRQQYPPQETGLTCNSWYGKFHLEMHWWHSVHFALWGRSDYLSNTLDWYDVIYEKAQAYATMQGYRGVRWPKMIGPEGIEAPSQVGPLLVWQQPHPIFYAELLYREHPDRKTLERFAKLVEATAEFMYDYAHWENSRKCYVLGPPIISAREGNSGTFEKNINPTFELAYWSWGLRKANDWRERLGLKRHAEWDFMAERMAPWPVVDGVYVEAESVLEKDGGHPTQLAAYGFLPESRELDKEIMRKTLRHVLDHWDWTDTWGWDYPLIAMTAVRLGEPQWALEALLKEVQKNTYLPNGHNFQNESLPLYLPGNGGLLAVVALMCAGWDGCTKETPGFPDDGLWTVKWEGLKPSI